MTLVLNIIWLILGGWLMGLAWLLSGLLLAVTIIGLPWARAALNIGLFAFWPFGREAVNRRDLRGQSDIGTGAFGLIGNILWFLLAGLWLAIMHVIFALWLGLTIIGIPFAIGHLKLAGASLFPVGKAIVPKAVALEIARERAQKKLMHSRETAVKA